MYKVLITTISLIKASEITFTSEIIDLSLVASEKPPLSGIGIIAVGIIKEN